MSLTTARMTTPRISTGIPPAHTETESWDLGGKMTHAPWRFITQSPRIRRAIWVLAVTLAMAAVVSCGSYSASGNTARNESQTTAPVPALSAAFISAVNSTDVQIVTTSAAAPVTEQSAVAAALAQLPPGSSATAAGLVMLTNAQHPAGVLAWAIETSPAGGFHAASGGPPGAAQQSPPPRNFRVDFVDASTGAWLEAVEGYSTGL